MQTRFMLAGVMAMAWMAAAVARGAEMPAVEIPACRAAPVMDGNPHDAAWEAALTITNFVILDDKDGFSPATNVTAKLMRDAEWLYVGFDIRHPLPDSIVPKVTQRDGRVQGENCVKVAFDPGTGGKQWYHFRLSAGNVRSDQRNSVSKGIEMDWNIPWRSAARITGTGWQAEIALPFALLMGLGDPAQARMNLIVHTFTPVRDAYAVEIGQKREVASWARVPSEWWKAPERFIAVQGLDKAAFKGAFLPMLAGVNVGAYSFADGKYVYKVSGKIRNYSSREGKIAVRVRDIPVVGEPGETLESVNIAGGADAPWTVTVPVPAVVRRSIRVAMESDSGEVLESMLIENPPVLDLFSAYLDRNYYTTEAQAGVVCRIGLPDEGLKDTRLAVRTEAGKLLGETLEVRPETRWAFSLKQLPEGSHPVRIEFRRKDGALIADQAVMLIKRAPKPGKEWKIDRVNRIVLDNGKPFFAYGILFGGWVTNAFNEANYREIAEAGFNCLMYWAAPGTVEATLAALDTVQRYGMHMVVVPDGFADSDAGFKPKLPEGISKFSGFTGLKGQVLSPQFPRAEKSRIYADVFQQATPLIRAGIEAVRDHPALMSYESFDEPMEAHVFDQYAQGRELYRLINETDGYHPVRTLWNCGKPSVAEDKYMDWFDIFGRDPYWAPPVVSLRSSPVWVAFQASEMWAMGANARYRHPIWVTPVLEMYSGNRKRYHLPAEQRAQTYLAIIQGASGLFYFVYPAVHQATWDMMRKLGAEIKEIYPYLAAPVPEQQVTYEGYEIGYDPAKSKWPDVLASLRRHPEGGYALLVANGQPWPVQATFRPELAGMQAPVKRAFGPETYAVTNGAFSEQLEPFATRVYLIRAAPADGVVTVTVQQTALKEHYVPESEIPPTGRPGKKNIMPNPSFEEATLPDWPDYWFAGLTGIYPDQRVGRENAVCTLDTENPYQGRRSLRISGNAWPRFQLSPQNDRPTEYVWSAYMRADRDGRKVQWRDGANRKNTTFELTTKWQRYSCRIVMPANSGSAYYIRNDSGKDEANGRFWIDAMQFERGTEPTEFEP